MGFLDVAEEGLYLIEKKKIFFFKSASFRDIIYPPRWELSVLDGGAYCIMFAEDG